MKKKTTIKRNDPKTLTRMIKAEAPLLSQSYKDIDKNSASVNVVVASGAPVYREKWDESKGWVPYERRLSITKNGVRLGRFVSCGPVLNNHQNGSWGESVRDTPGRVNRAWIEDKDGSSQLIAEIILSKITKEDREIAEKVKYRFIRSVSVGAEVFSESDVTKDEDTVQQLLVDDWEPFEVSLVMVPADANCVVRSLTTNNRCMSMSAKDKTKRLMQKFSDGEATLAEVEELRNLLKSSKITQAEPEDEDKQDEDEETRELEEGEAAEAAADAAATAVDDVSVEVTPEEEEEIAAAIEEIITDVVDDSDGGDAEEGADADIALARARRLARMKERVFRKVKPMQMKRNRGGMNVRSARGSHQMEEENREVLQRKMSDAFADRLTEGLFYRYQEKKRGSDAVVERNANEFRGRIGLQKIARTILQQHGVKNVWELSKAEVYNAISGGYESSKIIKRTGGSLMVSTDFVNLFSTSMNASVIASYEWRRGEQSFDSFVKRVTVDDFQEQELIWIGESGKLHLTKPGADAPEEDITDGKETYKIATYSRTMKVTRQAVINDKTGELQRVLLSGKGAADVESDLVYDQLHNGTWQSQPVFSAARNNLTTGAAYALLADSPNDPFGGIEKIDVGLATIKSDDNSSQVMGFKLKTLLVPAALQAKALRSQSKEFTATTPHGVNPFVYDVVVEARLDGYSSTAYYGIANEAGVFRNFIELGTLSSTPITKTDEKFSNDVLRFKLTHDCGSKILDYRLAHKVTGV